MQRHILVAVDTEAASVQAWQYVLDALYREGDALHVAHVALTSPPHDTVLHMAPSTTYSVPGGASGADAEAVAKVENWLQATFVQVAAPRPVSTHVYLDKESAAAADVRDTIVQAAQEQQACMIVVALHQRQPTLLQQLTRGGSVADALLASSPIPVMAVPRWPV